MFFVSSKYVKCFRLFNLRRRWHCTMQNKNHVERTNHNFRAKTESRARILEIINISPTVKKLILKVFDVDFSFKAGQWVDFNIPQLEVVGGYSMCSSPHKLTTEQKLDLAVKYSSHPPAHWVHTQCQPGCEVTLRVGGDFFYDPDSLHSGDVLLIGGGVGINPLLSILQTFVETQLENGEKRKSTLCLLYSAKNSKELLFQEEMQRLCSQFEEIRVKFFITQQKLLTSENKESNYYKKRIDADVLREVFESGLLNIKNVSCFICGPGSMIDSVEKHLLTLSLEQHQIIYEKWW